MKVSVVKDKHGKVIATYEHGGSGGTTLKRALKSGETVHEVDAPDDYAKNIKEFYKHHSR
jgi:hypothetical protein